MPSISTILEPQFQSSFFRASPTGYKCPRIAASWTMTTDSDFLNNNKKKEVSVQLSSLIPPVSRVDTIDLSLTILLHDKPCLTKSTGYSDQCKMKFADEEFNAIKKRQKGDSSTCIITVRKEQKNVKRSIKESVVGTLDLNIRYLLLGETFPEELVEAPRFCSIDRTPSSRYGYIANLCVAKSARRKGVASNMLHFAVESAKSNGVVRVYAHVDRNNKPALILYQNLGFEVVEMANRLLVKNKTYVLRLQM